MSLTMLATFFESLFIFSSCWIVISLSDSIGNGDALIPLVGNGNGLHTQYINTTYKDSLQ